MEVSALCEAFWVENTRVCSDAKQAIRDPSHAKQYLAFDDAKALQTRRNIVFFMHKHRQNDKEMFREITEKRSGRTSQF